jgi:hypothetical protein
MLGYKSLKPLFEFLAMLRKQQKNTWIHLKFDHGRIHAPSDDGGNKVVVQAAHYIVLNYDKVFIFDNQLWLFIQYYVVENYVRVPIFIYLDWMVTRLKSDTLIKVIMEVLIIGGGLPQDQVTQKFICFRTYGIKVFQGTRIGVTN